MQTTTRGREGRARRKPHAPTTWAIKEPDACTGALQRASPMRHTDFQHGPMTASRRHLPQTTHEALLFLCSVLALRQRLDQ